MLITAQRLCKSYRTRRGTVNALQEVSLQLQAGEIVALLGPNGAGKTTFVKCLLGLIYPDSGEVRLCGFDPFCQPREALAQVGAILEGGRNIYWQLSALENLLFFAGIAGILQRVARERATRLLEQLGLAHRQHEVVGNFSRGMQRSAGVFGAVRSGVATAARVVAGGLSQSALLGVEVVKTLLPLRVERLAYQQCERTARQRGIAGAICVNVRRAGIMSLTHGTPPSRPSDLWRLCGGDAATS